MLSVVSSASEVTTIWRYINQFIIIIIFIIERCYINNENLWFSDERSTVLDRLHQPVQIERPTVCTNQLAVTVTVSHHCQNEAVKVAVVSLASCKPSSTSLKKF